MEAKNILYIDNLNKKHSASRDPWPELGMLIDSIVEPPQSRSCVHLNSIQKLANLDEEVYKGLLETIYVLRENPAIIQQLDERENGEFINEEEFQKYVQSYL